MFRTRLSKGRTGLSSYGSDYAKFLTQDDAPILSEINDISHGSSNRCKRCYVEIAPMYNLSKLVLSRHQGG